MTPRAFGVSSRRRALTLLLVLIFVATGCVRLTPDIYESHSVHDMPDAEIAIVRGKSASIGAIDGKRIEHSDPNKYYETARLLSGSHTVNLRRQFMVSVLLVMKGYIEADRSYSLNLEAGHVYELHADRTTGPGFRVYMWIKDATTGKLVAGQDPDRAAETELERNRRLVEAGDPEAQYRQAFQASSPIERRRLFCLAALNGHGKAAAQLGLIYSLGLDGFPQDRIEAHKWYAIAGRMEVEGATAALARLAQYLTPDEIREAERYVSELSPEKCRS